MARLGDICIQITDGSHNPPASVGESKYLMLSSKNIDDDCITLNDPRYLSKDDFDTENKRTNIEPDDLLMTIVGTIGRVAIVPNAFTKICVQRSVAVLKPKSDIVYNRFLMYHLQNMRPQLERESRGVAQKGIYLKQIGNLTISLPPLDEQRKIAAVLDKVSDLIAKRRQQLDKLDEMVKARFVEMFGDPTINNLGIALMPMTEVCSIIDGDRGSNYSTQDEFTNVGYCLFLNAKNVTANGFDFKNCMFITKEKDELLRKGHLNRGDVVLTTRGTIGNLAFYDDSVPFENVRINSGMVILRMNHELVSEQFFIEQFKMQLSLIKEKIASGSAQPQLPISTMNKIMMLLPPIDAQNQFAFFVTQTEKTKTPISHSLEKLETLKKALMQEYFG